MAVLRSKRVARRALAIVAIGSLAGALAVVPGAGAQTTNTGIAGSLKVTGPVPTGVASASVAATCTGLTGLSAGATYAVSVSFAAIEVSRAMAIWF